MSARTSDTQLHAQDTIEGVSWLRSHANEEVERLIADVEDLVRKLAHVGDAEIARLRQKVEKTLEAARKSPHEGATRVRASGQRAAKAADGYVYERPWTAVGLAAAVGVLLGALSARR